MQKFTFYEWRKKRNREILFWKEGNNIPSSLFSFSHSLTHSLVCDSIWFPTSHCEEDMDSKLVWTRVNHAPVGKTCLSLPTHLPYHFPDPYVSLLHKWATPSGFFLKRSIPRPTDCRQISLLTGPISTAAFHGAFVLAQSLFSNNWTSNWNICEVRQAYNVNQTSGTYPQSIWTLSCGTACMVFALDSFFFSFAFTGKVPTHTYPSLQPLALLIGSH